MNHYPDNYHSYGRDATNMQGMGYGGGYRDPSAMRGHPTPDYQGGSYPMSHHQGDFTARGMYGHIRPGTYPNMPNYGHFNSSGYMGHQGGMVSPYYNSHGQQSTPAEGYGMHHSQHLAMMGQSHNAARQPSGMAPAAGSQHCVSPTGQDSYGTAYPGQGSPSRMQLQHQGHASHPQVPVPPHPMRQTNAQQNPQEVADNILQMASSYPSNQTVQVPLKNRPAPYHIPRSPHYVPRQEHPHHTSPSPHQQQALSSHASPSPTSGVKSPINQNPTPSPGPGMLRSPSGQVMSPCGSQRSPSHSGPAYPSQAAVSTVQTSQMTSMSQASHPAMTSSNSQAQQYHNNHQHHHNHSQQSHLVQQSGSPHYSPCSMVQSPYSATPSAQTPATSYSPHCHNHNAVGPHHHNHHPHHHQPSTGSMVSSPHTNMSTPYVSSPNSIGQGSTFAQSSANSCNNPLMSLEKLVMLPETQVVDPKSVVNDACLSTQSEEGPKNVEDPAERPAESSGHSVGCSGVSSSLTSHAQPVDQTGVAKSVSETALNSTSSQPKQNVTATSNPLGSNSVSDQPVSGAADSQNIGSGQTCANSAPEVTEGNSVVQSSATKPADQDSVSKTIITPVKSDVHNGIGKSSSSNLLDNHVPGSPAFKHSHVHAKTDTESRVDLHPSSLSSDVKVPQKDIKLKVIIDRESDVLSKLSSQEVDDKSMKPVNSKDTKDLTEKEITIVPNPNLNDSSYESSNEMFEKESDSHGKAVDSSLIALSKDIRAKEEIKISPVPCHPPSVLSEVPIILNGVESATVCEAGEDQELDCNGIHARVHNSLSNIVKSKLGYSRHRAGIRPCSIAVEASERTVCERFSFRRNIRGRVTRASINRGRNNSTGNADSDESLENFSSPTIITSIDPPQDGMKKRGPSSSSKRNGFSKSHVVTSLTKNSDNSSTTKVPLDRNTCPPHSANGATAGSEEEPCYYEGVDSSYDVYLNTLSSDESGCCEDKGCESQCKEQEKESFTSSTETEKPMDDNTVTSSPSDKKETSCAESENGESITPPSKRLKASSGSTSIGNVSLKCTASQESNEVIDLTSETFSPKLKRESSSPDKQRVRSAEKFRPSILGKRSVKYPVVVLEKSPIVSPKLVSVKSENMDLINISEGSTPQQLVKANLPEIKSEVVSVPDIANPEPAVDVQNESLTQAQKAADVKQESDVPTEPNLSSVQKKNSPKKKPQKKKAAKPKGKRKEIQSNRQSDVTDSFKSMKFGRTLDLMKANRKRESGSIGPFVRIVGQRSSPKTVSVFAQPTAEILAAAKQGKASTGAKKGQTLPSVTTVHMVSNLSSKQPPMVPSARTISCKPWVCAFCGHRSSYKFLGDLFGPYFKETEVAKAEQIAVEESKKADAEKNVKPQDSGKKNVAKGQVPGTSGTTGRHNRRKSALHPLVVEPPPPSPEELWVHQACALWSPGVCLVGNKMYGLDEAAKDAAENVCSECKNAGAMIGCLHKGCPMKYHFVCAVQTDCYMDEENLSCLCPKHKEKKLGSASKS
ncbi:hypothetical protein EGW08_003250 [Elysia chlorotica]|uniref:PHD-type domain-containing protein n=1 Tax=Elysia chlorotica TaxID=188477 RepID=A0A433U5C5_ELYCH|nr:hypothetical protein EGW08_003250 [Elysia chlorotica]